MSQKLLLKNALTIVQRLQAKGFLTFFAGGCVRDDLMGIDAGDIDIATEATPEDISKIFRNVHGIGESFGVMLIVEGGHPYEVATFREEGEYDDGRHPNEVAFSTPEKDALRRDFTINGMFVDPLTDELIDYVGGQEDIKKQIIRTIGVAEDRFSEDYLRMLRAVRFSARFDFAIEPATWDALCKFSHHIVDIAPERIFQELSKMLTGPAPAKAVRLLQASGLLKHILPEIEAMVGVEQPKEYHPEGDVFEHTCQVIENLGPYPSLVLGWAALLHDIGKPPTQTFTDRIRFNNHHHVGSKMAIKVMARLRASNALTNDVIACVDNHMHFISVQEMRQAKLRRFLGRPTIETELLLHKADCEASNGDISNYTFLKEKQEEFAEEGVKPEPLVQGKDLIASGYAPSRDFGEVIRQVYDAQLEGIVQTKEDALIWVKEHYPKL